MPDVIPGKIYIDADGDELLVLAIEKDEACVEHIDGEFEGLKYLTPTRELADLDNKRMSAVKQKFCLAVALGQAGATEQEHLETWEDLCLEESPEPFDPEWCKMAAAKIQLIPHQ